MTYDAINDHFQQYKNMCEWVAVIDIDEYIFPVESINEKITHNFIRYKLMNSTAAQIRMPYFVLCSHGLKTRPHGLIIDNYWNGYWYPAIKTMAKTNLVKTWGSPHYPVLLSGQVLTSTTTAGDFKRTKKANGKTLTAPLCQYLPSILDISEYCHGKITVPVEGQDLKMLRAE